MNPEFWAILGLGAFILMMLAKMNDNLAETNRRLQNFWEDMLDQRRSDWDD